MALRRFAALLAATAALLSPALVTAAAAAELNVYSSRHYDTDQALYDGFTAATGITVNRIEEKGDVLLQRLKAEGANSPADVFITVDAGNLWRADQDGLFQPVESAVLAERIPANLRHPQGHWFGFATRVRTIMVADGGVAPSDVPTYESLADPKLAGKLCIRPSSNLYNLSLMGALIDRIGEPSAEAWAQGVVANFARAPQGNDTDQIKAVASGECGVAVANHYYLVRLRTSADAADRAVGEKIRIVFPNQETSGAHVNISGAGVLKTAPNREAAVKFLEYLASDVAQRLFADGAFE